MCYDTNTGVSNQSSMCVVILILVSLIRAACCDTNTGVSNQSSTCVVILILVCLSEKMNL